MYLSSVFFNGSLKKNSWHIFLTLQIAVSASCQSVDFMWNVEIWSFLLTSLTQAILVTGISQFTHVTILMIFGPFNIFKHVELLTFERKKWAKLVCIINRPPTNYILKTNASLLGSILPLISVCCFKQICH